MTTRNRLVPSTTQVNSLATPARQHLLKLIISSLLPASPISALFYAERLYSLDSTIESTVFLLALMLKECGREMEAINILRGTITFTPNSTSNGAINGEAQTGLAGGKRWNNAGTSSTATKTLIKTSIESSIRCARLYADCCQSLGREKEGREILAKVLLPGVPLVLFSDSNLIISNSTSISITTTTNQSYGSNESWIIELQLARLAQKGGEKERAIQSYRKVLEGNPWCWEAVEGLCKEGEPPNMDSLFPPRQILPPNIIDSISGVGIGGPSSIRMTNNGSSNSNTLTPIVPGQTGSILQTANQNQYFTSFKPPLGPSQTSAVNSSFSFIKSRPNEGLGFFTPPEAAGGNGVMGGGGVGVVGKGKERSLFGYGNGGTATWKKNGRAGAGAEQVEMSVDDGSFESSFYPSPGYGSSNLPMFTNVNAVASTSNGNSLFTPSAPTISTTTAAPGVKRARGGNSQLQQTSSNSILSDDGLGLPLPPPGRRVVRKVPDKLTTTTSNTSRRDTSLPPSATSSTTSSTATATGPTTRRSTRLSRDPSSTSTSSSMTLSRSQTSNHSHHNGPPSVTTTRNNKKRSKAGAGPSVLSDAGSDALSPVSHSHSSSPAPSSPGLSSIPFPSIHANSPRPLSSSIQLPSVVEPPMIDLATLEAEEYVENFTKLFGKAEGENCIYRCKDAIDTLALLPSEQQKSWRCWIAVGRAKMELLEYSKAAQAFQQARLLSPHLLQSMDLYSTLLWHLRQPVQLSFLAQELMALNPSSPISWIASGNVFSHLEDHAGALKCFRRAGQLGELPRAGGGGGSAGEAGGAGCVYAFTLSGHECVVLEEWERALGFFREAVRRDGRCYNAWFGLGNVYMQTGKYRLAEYHFRKAAELNPSNATLICCVGSVLERLGKRNEALELYEKACALAPESAAVRFKRVRILIDLKQYQLAETDLLQLKTLAPLEFNIHFTLGKLYKLMGAGKGPEMLKSFALATDLEPRMSVVVREWITKRDGEEDEEREEVDMEV